jgi:Glyoxalase-like domain
VRKLLSVTIACAVLATGAHAQTQALDRLDHLVYATPDLDAGIDQIEKLLGVRATPGGAHPGRGTRNALVALGPRRYLEIIGPDPDQPKPDQPRPFGIDGLSQPRLVTWAANETDLPRLLRDAAGHGITLGEITPGSRKRPDGLLLTWRYTNPRVVVADGVAPFFIDWGKTPHPSESAAKGADLVGLTAEHPDQNGVTKTLRDLGIALPMRKGPRPALVAAIKGLRGLIELR